MRNFGLAGVLLSAGAVISGIAQNVPQDSLLSWMNGIAQQDLDRRTEAIRQIHTVAEAEQRKRFVRKELLNDLGGLPDYHGPLNARVTGEIHVGTYTIEKLIYESLPGFYVTANLYRPSGQGRHPAVLLQAGHTQEGKPENQRIAANLAIKGFVVLCFDPIGQGERVQTYSSELDGPLAGWSVPEHILMGAQAELVGEGLARYFIWDAMRSLDYLTSRPDVDASRIGAAGCSGGGALTTFLGALDPRVKVVIPACYPSSFRTLFVTAGPHAEMVFPNLLASGLDTADFVELSAPTPWLLQATENDQFGFSHEGVEQVYREAQTWYDLYNARGNLGFMVAPGSHGMPLASREAAYGWMIRWLKNGDGDSREQPVTMFSNNELQVTPTGHVDDEPGSRKLYQILRDELRANIRKGSIAELRQELTSLGIPADGLAPKIKVLDEESNAGGKRQRIQFESEPGIWLEATLYLPSGSGRRPAVLLVRQYDAPRNMAKEMMDLGRVVLEMEPRTSRIKNNKGNYTGDWIGAMQANLIGKNLPAMRAHDILRGIDLLCAREDVDRDSIRGAARGVAGIWLLLAAAADPRLKRVWLDATPTSLRSALDYSMTTDLWDAVIPSFVLNWDLDDLVKAMGTRDVLWTDPANWMGGRLALGPRYRYRYVLGDITDDSNEQEKTLIREFLK
jgi:cephalosporin-C deacetylase-like acetyl esterase